jgi:hypothetical protein
MSFGRKGAVPGTVDALAARRAAFIAEERARKASAPHGVEARTAPDSGLPRTATYVREKSTGMAYLLWFFMGGLSAHRFYLGFTTSAVIQLAMAPLGYAMLIGKSPIGLFILGGAWLWILGDAFVIPSMVRKANARARQIALGPVFA